MARTLPTTSWNKLRQGDCLSADAIGRRTGTDQIARVVECWQILGKRAATQSTLTVCTNQCIFHPTLATAIDTSYSYHDLYIRFNV